MWRTVERVEEEGEEVGEEVGGGDRRLVVYHNLSQHYATQGCLN